MSYGFEVSNQLGEIVISSNERIFQFSHTRLLNPADPNTPNDYQFRRESFKDVYFMKLPVGSELGLIGFNNQIGGPGEYWRFTGPSPLEILVFREISELGPVSGGGYGLEVFDSSGDLTFTSKRQTLVAQSALIPSDESVVTIGDFTYINLPMGVRYERYGPNRNVYRYFHWVNRTSQTQVRQRKVEIFTGQNAPLPPFDPWPLNCMFF